MSRKTPKKCIAFYNELNAPMTCARIEISGKNYYEPHLLHLTVSQGSQTHNSLLEVILQGFVW